MDSAYGKTIFAALAFCAAWFASYTIWRSERQTSLSLRQRLTELEESLRPKIKVVGICTKDDPIKIRRSFELEIKNDLETNLDNCALKVTDIHLFKKQPDGSTTDYSNLYKTNAPWTLHMFDLRAEETKKLLICDYLPSNKSLVIVPLTPPSEHLSNITFISAGDIEIVIYGAPSPTTEKLHLALTDNAQLTMTCGAPV